MAVALSNTLVGSLTASVSTTSSTSSTTSSRSSSLSSWSGRTRRHGLALSSSTRRRDSCGVSTVASISALGARLALSASLSASTSGSTSSSTSSRGPDVEGLGEGTEALCGDEQAGEGDVAGCTGRDVVGELAVCACGADAVLLDYTDVLALGIFAAAGEGDECCA